MRSLFEAAPLPAEAANELEQLLDSGVFEGPLAVRSSSQFEDAFLQPFAGIYTSVMVPNAPSVDRSTRLAQLTSAVKQVYASVYSQEGARDL